MSEMKRDPCDPPAAALREAQRVLERLALLLADLGAELCAGAAVLGRALIASEAPAGVAVAPISGEVAADPDGRPGGTVVKLTCRPDVPGRTHQAAYGKQTGVEPNGAA